jgi:hypothetical protein
MQAFLTAHQRAHDRRHVGHARRIELLAEADITIVIADHEEAARHQRVDQFDRPQGQLRTQPHDQQHRPGWPCPHRFQLQS